MYFVELDLMENNPVVSWAKVTASIIWGGVETTLLILLVLFYLPEILTPFGFLGRWILRSLNASLFLCLVCTLLVIFGCLYGWWLHRRPLVRAAIDLCAILIFYFLISQEIARLR